MFAVSIVLASARWSLGPPAMPATPPAMPATPPAVAALAVTVESSSMRESPGATPSQPTWMPAPLESAALPALIVFATATRPAAVPEVVYPPGWQSLPRIARPAPRLHWPGALAPAIVLSAKTSSVEVNSKPAAHSPPPP